ncbi:MAG: hypothetical protein GY725_17710 [bacterium]|nr:hypothetical protein [bacterium]
MKTASFRIALGLAIAGLCSGCMFKVSHELPPKTYFGKLPNAPAATEQKFERQGHKNWWLAGLVPYSDWGTRDLLASSSGVQRIEDLEIETTFDTFDTIVWVIPGFAYGYYLWAPRSIKVKGVEVR